MIGKEHVKNLRETQKTQSALRDTLTRLIDLLGNPESKAAHYWAQAFAQECEESANAERNKDEIYVTCYPPLKTLQEFVLWLVSGKDLKRIDSDK